MKKTSLRKIGKIGKINLNANQKIAEMWSDMDINYCEVCPVLHDMGLLFWQCLCSGTNAHRHNRIWYRGNSKLLYNYTQVLFACIPSHEFMDNNPEIKEKVFMRLRGNESES